MFNHLYPKLDIITATTGYKELKKKQQQIIRLSLKFQKRVNDKMVPDLPKHMAEVYYSLNCHRSVLMLETEKYTGYMRNKDIPLDFFRATYHDKPVKEPCDVYPIFSKIKPPFVIHLSKIPNGYDTETAVYHTMLALEITTDKDLVIWEKKGNVLPFQITNIADEISEYSGFYWGFRQLRQ